MQLASYNHSYNVSFEKLPLPKKGYSLLDPPPAFWVFFPLYSSPQCLLVNLAALIMATQIIHLFL